MPKPQNTALRILIPLVAIGIGVLVVFGTLRGSPTSSANTPPIPAATPNPVAAPKDSTADPKAVAGADVSTKLPDAAPQPTAAPVANATPITWVLRAKGHPGQTTEDVKVGSLDPKGPINQQLSLSREGAGVRSLELSKHFLTIKQDVHMQIQTQHTLGTGDSLRTLMPFAVLGLEVTPPGGAAQQVNLFDSVNGAPVWVTPAEGPTGRLVATIEDTSGNAVLRVIRDVSVTDGSNVVTFGQWVENLTDVPLTVRWFQVGMVDLPLDSASYGGDRRFLRIAYLLPPARDPTRTPLALGEFDKAHANLLGTRYATADGSRFVYLDATQWPTQSSQQNNYELAWLGVTNRYYGVAMIPLYTTPQGVKNPLGGVTPLNWIGTVDRIVLDGGDGTQVIGTRIASVPITLNAGKSADFTHGVFAGPLSRAEMKEEPLLHSMLLDRMVVHNFGGPCGWCTFETLTGLLLGVLHFLHDYVVKDWALAIVFLVIIVRTVLHPLTRWTQIKMARFGKQMAAMGPKQKILQEKYASEPLKLQQETTKLWREEGISPTGFLGCLPSFAQTPVWIALSAVLFFAVELRHQGAFYGIFQSIQPVGSPFWYFLGDLAEPDHFYYFGRTVVTLPLLGPVNGFNILPILLGFMFWLQQTYFNPAPTTPQTPEQEMQMKVMKYMTIIMFPVMMYNAPAGLSLYFLVNTSLAIVESKWVRSYMEKHDMLNVDKMRAERLAKRGNKPVKETGFMAALQQYAEKKQKETETRFGQERPKK